MNKDFLLKFASFIKQRINPKTNIITELSNYVNCVEDDSSDTDKYFKSKIYDYDALYFEFLTCFTEPLEYSVYCDLDREKIIEYALYLIGKNVIN